MDAMLVEMKQAVMLPCQEASHCSKSEFTKNTRGLLKIHGVGTLESKAEASKVVTFTLLPNALRKSRSQQHLNLSVAEMSPLRTGLLGLAPTPAD